MFSSTLSSMPERTCAFEDLSKETAVRGTSEEELDVEESCAKISYKANPLEYAISRFTTIDRQLKGIYCQEVLVEGNAVARYVFDFVDYYTGERRSISKLLDPSMARPYRLFIVSDRDLTSVHPSWFPVDFKYSYESGSVESQYCFHTGGTLYSCDSKQADQLKEIIKSIYSPDLVSLYAGLGIKLSESPRISYCKYTQKQLHKLYTDLVVPGSVLCVDNGAEVYPGFRYYSPYTPDMSRDFFCMWIDSVLVGIIYYGMYGEEFCISYIDIHKKYRNQGLATQLIKAFGECVSSPTGMLSLSSETELGAKCHIAEKFHKYVKHMRVVQAKVFSW